MKPRLAIFCGASSGSDTGIARASADAARAIVAAGFDLVYGGGRVGLMGIVADAALAAGGEVVGVIPRALAHAELAHAGISDLQIVETMHERKARMAELSDGFIALPGGYGTLDEFAEMLTWRQLGLHDKPLGLLDHAGFYQPLLRLFDDMERTGFVSRTSRSLLVSALDVPTLLQAMFERGIKVSPADSGS